MCWEICYRRRTLPGLLLSQFILLLVCIPGKQYNYVGHCGHVIFSRICCLLYMNCYRRHEQTNNSCNWGVNLQADLFLAPQIDAAIKRFNMDMVRLHWNTVNYFFLEKFWSIHLNILDFRLIVLMYGQNEFPILKKANEAYREHPAFEDAMPGKQPDAPPEARDWGYEKERSIFHHGWPLRDAWCKTITNCQLKYYVFCG